MTMRSLLAALCLSALASTAIAAENDPPPAGAATAPTAQSAPPGDAPMTLRILAEDEKSINESERKQYQVAKARYDEAKAGADKEKFDFVLSTLNRIVGTSVTIVITLIFAGVVGAVVASVIARRRSRHWVKRSAELSAD